MALLTLPIKTFYLASLIYGAVFIFLIFKRRKLSVFMLAAAFLIHLFSDLFGRYLIWPYCNVMGEPFFLPLCLAALTLIVFFLGCCEEGLCMIPLIIIFSFCGVFFTEGFYPSFNIYNRGLFPQLFHLFQIIAHAFLFAGAWISIFIVIKNKQADISLSLITWGFCFYTVAGLFGMLWNYQKMAETISWNHFYFHSTAIWFFYAGYLHLGIIKQWAINKRAMVLVGGSLLIFWFDYLPQIGQIHLPGICNVELY